MTARDFGAEAQRVAQAHLARVQEVFWIEEEGGDPDVYPAFAPFDGCDTCVVREVLVSAWEVVDAYVDDALRGLRSQVEAATAIAVASPPPMGGTYEGGAVRAYNNVLDMLDTLVAGSESETPPNRRAEGMFAPG